MTPEAGPPTGRFFRAETPIRGLVSVPICVYNGEDYLAEAIDSVLAQTYRPIEVIVVDDGSTDRTPEIIRGYGDRITGVRIEHAGVGPARNRGLAECRGEYVAIQDADDVWAPGKLELQVRALEGHPDAAMAGGLIRNFLSPELDPAEFAGVVISEEPLRGFSLQTFLVRRSVFERIGVLPEEDHVGQAADWFMRFRDAGLGIVDLPQVMTFRRIHRNNEGFRRRSTHHERLLWLKRGLDRRRAGQQGDEGPRGG